MAGVKTEIFIKFFWAVDFCYCSCFFNTILSKAKLISPKPLIP